MMTSYLLTGPSVSYNIFSECSSDATARRLEEDEFFRCFAAQMAAPRDERQVHGIDRDLARGVCVLRLLQDKWLLILIAGGFFI